MGGVGNRLWIFLLFETKMEYTNNINFGKKKHHKDFRIKKTFSRFNGEDANRNLRIISKK